MLMLDDWAADAFYYNMEQYSSRDHNDAPDPLVELEQLYKDPKIEAVLAEAAQLIDQINDMADDPSQMTDADKQVQRQMLEETVQYLDDKWPLMNCSVKITGMATVPDLETGQPVERQLIDHDCTSKGFFIRPEEITLDDDDTITYYKVLHCIHTAIPVDNGGGTRLVQGTTELDAILDYYDHSVYLAEQRLRYHHPDIIDEVDSLILNEDSETDALMALKETVLDVSDERNEDVQMVRDLCGYISNALEFDHEVPYLLTIKGQIYTMVPGEATIKTLSVDNVHALADVNGVHYGRIETKRHDGDATVRYTLVLSIELRGQERGDPSQQHYVPLSAIREFSSLRTLAQ